MLVALGLGLPSFKLPNLYIEVRNTVILCSGSNQMNSDKAKLYICVLF